MKVKKFESQILQVKDIAANVKQFRFSTPDDFKFEAGQFMSVILKDETGKEFRRSYSIASSPSRKGYLEFAITIVTGGKASGVFQSLKQGDRVGMIGPLGVFGIKKRESDIVFIATGTGVAPFRSMIRSLLESGFQKKITLLAGVRHEEHILYEAEWKALEMEHDNFKHYQTVSQPKEGYTGEKGRVQILIDKYAKDKDSEFYLCGLFAMIDDVSKFLMSRGIGSEKIHFERYD